MCRGNEYSFFPGQRTRCRAVRRRRSSVRTTRPRAPPGSMLTMLTLSERWLTTHTSSSVRAATATGSNPTGTEARCRKPMWAHGKDLESVVGRIHGKEQFAAGRQCQWPYLCRSRRSLSQGGPRRARGGRATAPPIPTAGSKAAFSMRIGILLAGSSVSVTSTISLSAIGDRKSCFSFRRPPLSRVLHRCRDVLGYVCIYLLLLV